MAFNKYLITSAVESSYGPLTLTAPLALFEILTLRLQQEGLWTHSHATRISSSRFLLRVEWPTPFFFECLADYEDEVEQLEVCFDKTFSLSDPIDVSSLMDDIFGRMVVPWSEHEFIGISSPNRVTVGQGAVDVWPTPMDHRELTYGLSNLYSDTDFFFRLAFAGKMSLKAAGLRTPTDVLNTRPTDIWAKSAVMCDDRKKGPPLRRQEPSGELEYGRLHDSLLEDQSLDSGGWTKVSLETWFQRAFVKSRAKAES
jgi:hypothetical protein